MVEAEAAWEAEPALPASAQHMLGLECLQVTLLRLHTQMLSAPQLPWLSGSHGEAMGAYLCCQHLLVGILPPAHGLGPAAGLVPSGWPGVHHKGAPGGRARSPPGSHQRGHARTPGPSCTSAGRVPSPTVRAALEGGAPARKGARRPDVSLRIPGGCGRCTTAGDTGPQAKTAFTGEDPTSGGAGVPQERAHSQPPNDAWLAAGQHSWLHDPARAAPALSLGLCGSAARLPIPSAPQLPRRASLGLAAGARVTAWGQGHKVSESKGRRGEGDRQRGGRTDRGGGTKVHGPREVPLLVLQRGV